MKTCPRCGRIFRDSDINFCLNDGELLAFIPESPNARTFVEDSKATKGSEVPQSMHNYWQYASPDFQSNSQLPAPQNEQYLAPAFGAPQNQTMPTVAFVLGILAFLMVCCAGGVWLGIPAAALGYLGMRNADADPARYGGRGLAIAGLVLGIVTFLASVVFLIVGAVS